MEQTGQIKCHLCGRVADYSFAYARFSEREAFLGVIFRGVCRECLREYIERIKRDRQLRGELLLWPMILLPVGALLAALSDSVTGRLTGFILLGLAAFVPIVLRLFQRREAMRVRRTSEQENFVRYSEQMCREDAQRTSRQTKLIYLRPEYAKASASEIAREMSLDIHTAERIVKLSATAQERIRDWATYVDRV